MAFASILFIYGILILNYVSCAVLDTSCTVSKYEELDAAAKKCDVLTIKDITIPSQKTMTISAKKGAKLIFTGKVTQVPANFSGPIIKIQGTNLDISGTSGHIFNGNGPKFWKGANTNYHRPRFIDFHVDNSQIRNLHIKNCPGGCTAVHGNNVVVSDIHIDNKDGYAAVAGKNFAKNTDGFGINSSKNVTIKNSVVYNQDDCVVVNGGHDLKVDNLWCNGSHGLSLSVSGGDVYDVHFKNSHMEHGSNGIHIKTHNDGSSGRIHNIFCSNITLKNVERYGITIQQNYPKGEAKANIPITNLTFDHIVGTVAGPKSMVTSIICAKGGCSDWKFTNIKITGAKAKNECQNVPKGISC